MGPFRVLIARLARLNGEAPRIEQVADLPAGDPAAVGDEIRRLFPERRAYVPAIGGVLPPSRLLWRQENSAKRFAEADYLSALLAFEHKIAADKWSFFLINPLDGRMLDPANPSARDVLLSGAPTDELLAEQQQLLDLGLLPRRMEISTLPMLGGVQHHQAVLVDSAPAAVVEIGNDRTRLSILGKTGVHPCPPIDWGIGALAEAAAKDLQIADAAVARARLLSADAALLARAPRLLRALVRHLKPSIERFEIETGQRVNDLYCAFLPPGLGWIAPAVASALQMQELRVDCPAWLSSLNIDCPAEIASRLGTHWLSLFSLIARLEPTAPNAKKTG